MVENELLFSRGLFGEHVERYRTRVRKVVSDTVTPRLEQAEQCGRFPVEIMPELGRSGLIAERWRGGEHGDAGRAVILAEELGRAGCGGLAVGVSLHVETVISILRRFGANAHHHELLAGALDGALTGCVAASEARGGSDLNAVATRAERTASGWRVHGRKKFVSLGAIADVVLVLCQVVPDGRVAAPGRLAVVAVPRSGVEIVREHDKVGTASLDTVELRIAAEVQADAMIGRPGLGLAVISFGLTHERLAVAAQVTGVCQLAIGLAAAHLERRIQFGRPLAAHQAMSMRLADLAAQVDVLRCAVVATAHGLGVPGGPGHREVAGLKVTAARLVEHVVSECMHMFGGSGYLPAETPLGRLWRDARLARIGAGTDEMMWAIVGSGVTPDHDAYQRMVQVSA